MEIAIIGLPQSGKSTLFQIMTGINSSEMYGEDVVRGIAKVPDERFDHLVTVFNPEKITPAAVPFIDINASGEKAWDSIRNKATGADSILHILNCFDTNEISEIIKRYNRVAEELILSDLAIAERRIEKLLKLPKNVLGNEENLQLSVMPKVKDHLENGKPIRSLDLSSTEVGAIKCFSFWSMKPELIVINTSEGATDLASDFVKELEGSHAISICCQIELEIADLSKDEQTPFLESLGIKKPAFEKIIQTAFSQLEKAYYFTVGEDEVRAWIIDKGFTAPKAAAVIHQDFERGFIKAEVVSYKDFVESGNKLANAKAAGKQRLEGKDYIVQDGDIISFRFNV